MKYSHHSAPMYNSYIVTVYLLDYDIHVILQVTDTRSCHWFIICFKSSRMEEIICVIIIESLANTTCTVIICNVNFLNTLHLLV